MSIIKADFHTHSTYSTDGISTLREQVEAAIKKGLRILCITEHMDYDNSMKEMPGFAEDYPELMAMPTIFQCDTDAYMNELFTLKDEYSSKIDLRLGMELGLKPELSSHYKDYAQSYPFDFLIGSVHEAGGIDPYYPYFLDGRTPKEAYRFYFETELLCAQAISDYDVFGHIDYAIRYNTPAGFIFEYSDYADVLDMLLKTIIEAGKGIELNTGGFAYFNDEPNPRISILKRYRELGGEILTVGSDAHKAADLARYFDKAEDIIKACGFKYITVFKDRKPSFIAI